MALEHFNARTVVPSGVQHANVRHTSNYTVIGNHLAQHRQLSLTAIGLAVYIQSVPGGAKVGIKALAQRFTEGEVRIASALRELEYAGYLSRFQEQLPGGRLVTRTVSYNRPGGAVRPDLPGPPKPPEPEPPRPRVELPPPPPEPEPEPEPPAPEPEPEPDPEPANPPPAEPAVAMPAPQEANPARRQAAKALLGQLRRANHRLLLGERDIERLAHGVEVWLERGASPQAITAALTARLPDQPYNPAGLVAHRLAVQLPPILGPVYRELAYVPPDPFQTCTECDRAFRSQSRGKCRECAEDETCAA